jgi:hypothetical protein
VVRPPIRKMTENETIDNREQSPAHSAVTILLKAVAFTIPATLLPEVRPQHSHTEFGLAPSMAEPVPSGSNS